MAWTSVAFGSSSSISSLDTQCRCLVRELSQRKGWMNGIEGASSYGQRWQAWRSFLLLLLVLPPESFLSCSVFVRWISVRHEQGNVVLMLALARQATFLRLSMDFWDGLLADYFYNSDSKIAGPAEEPLWPEGMQAKQHSRLLLLLLPLLLKDDEKMKRQGTRQTRPKSLAGKPDSPGNPQVSRRGRTSHERTGQAATATAVDHKLSQFQRAGFYWGKHVSTRLFLLDKLWHVESVVTIGWGRKLSDAKTQRFGRFIGSTYDCHY